MHDGWELLIDYPQLSERAKRMMKAMAAAAPEGSLVSENYTGKRRNLMLYGPGSRDHLPLVQRARKRGGRVAMWDLGYWERRDGMRLAIDTLHPTAQQLELSPPGQGRRDFALREDADPAGPILLVGVGPKSVFAYGLQAVHQWERAKLADLRRRYPGRAVVYRPKGDRMPPLADLPVREGIPIEEALRGCSLVACRHSNVAVDACIAGVPVECEDGAAAALYAAGPAPTREERAEFLRRLTWWEWSRFEAHYAWKWIQRVTG